MTDQDFMKIAIAEAEASLAQGGIPVGAVLVRNGVILSRGHNRRVQLNDPIAHGEMDCIRAAGRQASYRNTILYTTLSPCMMCSGTTVQFGISRVVIGENRTFGGNESFLRSRGVKISILDDPSCKELMDRFIRECPNVWLEDIGQSNATTLYQAQSAPNSKCARALDSVV